MKKLYTLVALMSLVLPSTSVTFAASEQTQFAESVQELISAEQRLDSVIRNARDIEINNLSSEDIHNTDRTEKSQFEISNLKKIKSYRDLQTDKTMEETVQDLTTRNYQFDDDFLEVCNQIILYKTSNNISDPKIVVQHFNKLSGLKEKSNFANKIVSLSSNSFAEAYSISYSSWTKLTTSEKLLVASNPVAALQTNAIQKKAFEYTTAKFGSNGLGDKSDGYRHGIWNALMTRDISRAWAEAIATAHEDRPQSELDAKQSDGYYGWQHKNMDLNNNKVGRSVIAWYEYSINCSDSTVKSRISAKLTNKSGEIIWLHN